jgi:uncharacterized membrane protein YeaQ/YmgE (transglycosylase-associated protein family)
MDLSSLLIFLFIGALAGWLAGMTMKGRGFGLVGNIILGIVGALIGGFVFQINKNFNIKLGAGYGLRKMKTKYAEWKEDEDVYVKLETIPTETHYFHMLDVQLGLSYTFSFKNKQ